MLLYNLTAQDGARRKALFFTEQLPLWRHALLTINVEESNEQVALMLFGVFQWMVDDGEASAVFRDVSPSQLDHLLLCLFLDAPRVTEENKWIACLTVVLEHLTNRDTVEEMVQDSKGQHRLVLGKLREWVSQEAERHERSISDTRREAQWVLRAEEVQPFAQTLLTLACDTLQRLHTATTTFQAQWGTSADQPETLTPRQAQKVDPSLLERKCHVLHLISCLTYRNVFLQELAIQKQVPDLIAQLVRTFDVDQPRSFLIFLQRVLLLTVYISIERICRRGDAKHSRPRPRAFDCQVKNIKDSI